MASLWWQAIFTHFFQMNIISHRHKKERCICVSLSVIRDYSGGALWNSFLLPASDFFVSSSSRPRPRPRLEWRMLSSGAPTRPLSIDRIIDLLEERRHPVANLLLRICSYKSPHTTSLQTGVIELRGHIPFPEERARSSPG